MTVLDMNDPKQRQLAHDRLKAGVGPTMDSRAAVRERRKLWDDRVEKIHRERAASALKSPPSPVLPELDQIRRQRTISYPRSTPLTPLQQLEPYRKTPLQPRRPPTMALMLPLAALPKVPDPIKEIYKPMDPFEGKPCFYTQPDWSDASTDEDDEVMPDAPPRWNVSRRRANAMVVAVSVSFRAKVEELERNRAARLARQVPWESARLTMAQVASEIIAHGAEKKSMERHELGPAPCGFEYLTIGEEVHLARTDGNGSTIV
ncbi:hypothetical protein C8J57DRAFT_1372553 [Mycena rebaudengoi]|nr:hypothetical protein C8J57DRAFT_1372553 [Mycena rebaudengoi]